MTGMGVFRDFLPTSQIGNNIFQVRHRIFLWLKGDLSPVVPFHTLFRAI
jgi:hypothetical protein